MPSEFQRCPQCQSPLSPAATEGLCARCLWESLIHATPAEFPESDPLQSPGSGLADYEILEEIARGGMGVVYRARQRSLNRVVALKMVLQTRLPGEAAMQRFRLEAEAVAGLEHRNVVPIYEVGEEEGRPYFTMKHVPGGSLADALQRAIAEGAPMDPRRAAALVSKVARAVHHAHQRGILHRDIKPSNILIDESGEPLVSDFGLALALETDQRLTLSGAVVGTPAYLAPEQVKGGVALSTAVDVYSLGAILFEILAGHPVFVGSGLLEVLQRVANDEPVISLGDRDLETICHKCLRKEPEHRYASAEALAEELERWLRHEPILARPSTRRERIGKWGRRHPVAAAVSGLGALALVSILVVLLVANREVRRERNGALAEGMKARHAAAQADRIKTETRQQLYAADLLLAQHAIEDGNLNVARRIVESYRPKPKVSGGVGESGAGDLRGVEWRLLWKRCLGDPHELLSMFSNSVEVVSFSADSRWLAVGESSGRVSLWEFASRRKVAAWEPSDVAIEKVSLSRDGAWMSVSDALGRTKILDAKSGAVVWSHSGRNPKGVALSSDGAWIGVTDGELSGGTSPSRARVVEWRRGTDVLQVGPIADFEAFTPDGSVALVTRRREIGTEWWDIRRAEVVKTVPELNGSLTVSPDGMRFAAAAGEQGVLLASRSAGESPTWLAGKAAFGETLAFSADGAFLAKASPDQSVPVWNLRTGRMDRRCIGHLDAVRTVAYSPEGRWLVSGGRDRSVRIWPVKGEGTGTAITSLWPPYVISSDGSWLAARRESIPGKAFEVQLLNLATLQSVPLEQPSGGWLPQGFSSDGRSLLARGSRSENGKLPLLIWDLSRHGTSPRRLELELNNTNEVLGVAMNPAATELAVHLRWQTGVTRFDPFTGRRLGDWTTSGATNPGEPIAYAPDSHRLLAMFPPDGLRLWDLDHPGVGVSCSLPGNDLRAVAFSPDGGTIAVACEDHSIRLLDAATLHETGVLHGHQHALVDVAFSPDGRTLASCSVVGEVKLWSWPARREAATVVSQGMYSFVRFSPDGTRLVVGGWGRAFVESLPTLDEAHPLP